MRTFIYNKSQNYTVQQNFLQNLYNEIDGGNITRNKSKKNPKQYNNHPCSKLSNTYPKKS